MNTTEFAQSIDLLYHRLMSLTASKGEEYIRRDTNQFANFEQSAERLGLTREQVLMVALDKHLYSVTTYVRDRAAGRQEQYAEPISGRIDDAILYLLLLRGMTVENDDELGRRIVGQLFPGECRADFSSQPGLYVDGHMDPPGFVEVTGRGVATTLEVGGVTTARRTVVIDGPEPTLLVVCGDQSIAAAECRLLGIPGGSSALGAVDQLHGARPGTEVLFIHRGTEEDRALMAEVQERCDKQGLSLRVRHNS